MLSKLNPLLGTLETTWEKGDFASLGTGEVNRRANVIPGSLS